MVRDVLPLSKDPLIFIVVGYSGLIKATYDLNIQSIRADKHKSVAVALVGLVLRRGTVRYRAAAVSRVHRAFSCKQSVNINERYLRAYGFDDCYTATYGYASTGVWRRITSFTLVPVVHPIERQTDVTYRIFYSNKASFQLFIPKIDV